MKPEKRWGQGGKLAEMSKCKIPGHPDFSPRAFSLTFFFFFFFICGGFCHTLK